MDFNPFTQGYSQRITKAVGFSGQEHDFFLEEKARHLLELAQKGFGPISRVAALDVGCGIGLLGSFLVPHLRRLCGVDIAGDAIREARRNAPGAQYFEYDGSTLPFQDDEFEIAFAVCVLHHVRPAEWRRFIAEMHRVVRPGGIVALFEHNPLNPLTRLVVSRCEFDRDAVLLGSGAARSLLRASGLRAVERRYILFFPWRSRFLRLVERAFAWLPFGAQYYVFGRKNC
jgi:SAM-dependent methyltransferase